MPDPLLPSDRLDELRAALDGYTTDAVHELIGPAGRADLQRTDLLGVARRLPPPGSDRLATLVRLFLLGAAVDEHAARRALHPLPLGAAHGAGLVDVSAGSVRALLDLRPHAQDGWPGAPWWIVSDLGSDVRPGEVAADHVLGVGAASLSLAQATPRMPVARALDLGTGCGVQSLHLSTHATAVTGTDVSARALQLAATTAALSGQTWDLRGGSLLEPVRREQFDLVVANPPFVVSDAALADHHDYRDSGLAGDEVSAHLLHHLPSVLAPGGSAHLLANWIIPADGDWRARIAGWLPDRGCDAWVWQREVADPGEYVTLWLRDAGLTPHDGRWAARYDAWRSWFDAHGVAAIGMGYVALWQTDAASPVTVLEDVPQGIDQPSGAHLPSWIARQRWLRDTGDDAVLACALRAAEGTVRDRSDVLGVDGWNTASARLRQTTGLRWDVEVDDAVAALVAGCDGDRPLRLSVSVLAAALGRSSDEIAAAVLPVVRDLIGRGFLEPPTVP